MDHSRFYLALLAMASMLAFLVSDKDPIRCLSRRSSWSGVTATCWIEEGQVSSDAVAKKKIAVHKSTTIVTQKLPESSQHYEDSRLLAVLATCKFLRSVGFERVAVPCRYSAVAA